MESLNLTFNGQQYRICFERSSEKQPDLRIFGDDFFEKMNKLFEEHLLKKQGAGFTKDHFEPRQPCKICKHINADEDEHPCNECKHNPRA